MQEIFEEIIITCHVFKINKYHYLDLLVLITRAEQVHIYTCLNQAVNTLVDKIRGTLVFFGFYQTADQCSTFCGKTIINVICCNV